MTLDDLQFKPGLLNVERILLTVFGTCLGLLMAEAFLLLGAVFLGVGAQAATVREIQMLSLPITIFQVGMFSLCAAAASAPDSGLARFAQIFPFSSPLAMAARAATDDAKAVHLLALGWQALWVVLVVWLSVRLFRAGVLSGGSGWKFWRSTKGAAAALAAAEAASSQSR